MQMRPKKDKKEKHYSISQVNLFSMCPRKYRYTYVEKLPYSPIYNLESGKALHAGLEESNKQVIDGKDPMKAKEVVDFSVNTFKESNEDRIEEADFELSEGVDKFFGDIVSPVHTFKEVHEQDLIEQGIIKSESGFPEDFKLAGEKVVGYIDLETKDVIMDYKLLGRKKSQGAINNDPQLVLYEHVTGKKGFFMEFIRKRKRAELSQPRRTPSTARAILKWIEEQIVNIERAKKTGVFAKTQPTNWLCSRCQYRWKCWNSGNRSIS